MNDDEILATLRSRSGQLSPVELADLLARLKGMDLSQGIIITYFKRAFPSIPLGVLIESTSWMRVSGGGMSDEAFNEMLRPWLKDRDQGR